MLSVFSILAIVNVGFGIWVGLSYGFCIKKQDDQQNGSRLKTVNLFLLLISSVEIIYLLYLMHAETEYLQLFYVILTQIIWSSALLYMSVYNESVTQKTCCMKDNLEKHLRLYEEIKSIALLDGLTNIANRRNFDMFLKTELQRAASLKRPMSLILMDIDKFKAYNDTFGHLSGDKLLTQIGQILNHNVRSIDLPARYGGEEFCIILPDRGLTEATELAERLRKIIEASNFPDHAGMFTAKITASFGIATYDPAILSEPPDVEKIISIADKTLYKAKQQGRNQVFGSTIFQ